MSSPENPHDKLNNPWLVAVWPGMGHVAISAGYYLMAKLGMELLAEFSPAELFDVESVEVKQGVIEPVQRPRSRLFVWRDPDERRDIVVFIGEAQPQSGKYAFCHRLIEFAKELGVERVFTFAAMATQMHPEHEARVFAAATDGATLAELEPLELELLEGGQISGLNGILLGAAAEAGLPGACLLGEMPHIFLQFPFPKASLAVLETFKSLARLEVDTAELREQAQAVEQKLGEILDRVQHEMGHPPAVDEDYSPEPPEEPRLSAEDEARIEELFRQAEDNRAKAYELKQELDRCDVFKDYEDRFLDLFKRPE
jgi:proteasome assembly chaperone (PAC2) family protein